MEKIVINWSVSVMEGSESVSLEDLGHTSASWDELSEEEQNDVKQDYLDDLPDRVCIIVD